MCSLMHAWKPLYRHVHQLHHTNGSNISTLGSSYGDLADIGLSFVSFHLVVFLFMLHQRSWNLPAVILLVLFEVSAAEASILHASFAVWGLSPQKLPDSHIVLALAPHPAAVAPSLQMLLHCPSSPSTLGSSCTCTQPMRHGHVTLWLLPAWPGQS